MRVLIIFLCTIKYCSNAVYTMQFKKKLKSLLFPVIYDKTVSYNM